jgi:16S rRNA (adenine1518-N6/adenine1519-N6)-dimethyltransferase
MPLSPTETRELLAGLGHQPKRFLGQNFLVDGNIVRKSLELAQLAPGDTVVEIGPGLGTLTTALLEAGAVVWAVEKDRTLHAHLVETLAPRFPETFHLLEGDAVEHPLAGFSGKMFAGCPHPTSPTSPAQRAEGTPTTSQTGDTSAAEFKVVANLPYAIATPWLDAVLEGPLPSRMVLMLQQEAAQRYSAKPGSKSFGAISVFLQAAYDLAPGHKVAAACFYPRPDIESYLLHLVRKPSPAIFPREFKSLVRACFQQRRKQIGALLRGQLPGAAPFWREPLAACGHSEQTRPEAVSVECWQRLARSLPA